MQKRLLFFLTFFLLCSNLIFAQQPQKPNASELYNQIQKLNFLGSVLYLAAHPDDENTRLISYLSNQQHARTGYLSLTRGDGGQNLVGTELRELLGVIRTQELIEARKIDGGEQFFSRANDFGYSKNPEETLAIWNKEEVLGDVVYMIRKFQPDIVINRFDARSPGTTHGHHTASAMLGLEAFDKAGDASAFPNQLSIVSKWQPKRILFNTSWWFYGSKEKFEKADKSNLLQLQTGIYYPSIGKSNQEIAALSRSRHESQGFGSTGTRGDELEYLELLKGEMPNDKSNIFDGIDTSWNRVKGGKAIGEILGGVEKSFNFKDPAASIADLVKAYLMIQKLEDNHWKEIKSQEIKKIIAGCSGLYLEAVAERPEATHGHSLKVKVEAINRSNIPMQLTSIVANPQSSTPFQLIPLDYNNNRTLTLELPITNTLDYTQPYWLKEPGTVGMYQVTDQNKIGIPDVIREVKLIFNISINNVNFAFERNVIYKYNDDVKGEVYKPFDIVPDVTTAISEKVTIFNNDKTKTIAVIVKSGKDNIKGVVALELPKHWKVSPQSNVFSLSRKGEEQTVYFKVSPPKNAEEIVVKSVATIDAKRFDKEQISINYDHISKQQVLKPAEARLIRLDIETRNERVAYIMGAGDEVPKSLRQMGYEVVIVKPEEITPDKLKQFDVVITGIRAYNTVQGLAFKQQMLFDFVKEGHTMIAQYNTLDDFVTQSIAPYPLKISRERVTEENAVVTFLEPNHKVLNTPNKLTAKDFEGWKQEQGLYYPSEWDAAFVPILSASDKGESAKKGALLIAKHGKGHYIYTGLSFFRELPEGVSGAFRLMANLISLK